MTLYFSDRQAANLSLPIGVRKPHAFRRPDGGVSGVDWLHGSVQAWRPYGSTPPDAQLVSREDQPLWDSLLVGGDLRCRSPIRLICVSAFSAMSTKVIRAARLRRISKCRFPLSSTWPGLFVCGKSRAQAQWGRRYAKLEPHRTFLLEKLAEKADITMPELAAELAAATCEKADPASLSRWLIRIGYRFKNVWPAPSEGSFSGSAADQSASTYPASKGLLPAMMEIRALRSS